MYTLAFLALQGLTLEKVIAEIPHDAGAVLVAILLGLFIFFTWYGSRASVIARYQRCEPAPEVVEDHGISGSEAETMNAEAAGKTVYELVPISIPLDSLASAESTVSPKGEQRVGV